MAKQYIGKHRERGIWQFPEAWRQAYEQQGFQVAPARADLQPVERPRCLQPGTEPEKPKAPEGSVPPEQLAELVQRISALERRLDFTAQGLDQLRGMVEKLEQQLLGDEEPAPAAGELDFDDLVEPELDKLEAEQLLEREPGQESGEEMTDAERKAIAKLEREAVKEHLERVKDHAPPKPSTLVPADATVSPDKGLAVCAFDGCREKFVGKFDGSVEFCGNHNTAGKRRKSKGGSSK